jgi:hypothetical protein
MRVEFVGETARRHLPEHDDGMTNRSRFRGIVGIAATWGVALAAFATVPLALGVATGVVPSAIYGPRELLALAVRGVLLGGVVGGLFAWLLARRERGHSIATLSTRRVAGWGFVAAGLPAIVAFTAIGPVLPLGVMVAGTAGFGGIGSVLGTATLRIARRAEARIAGLDEAPRPLTP